MINPHTTVVYDVLNQTVVHRKCYITKTTLVY